VKRRKRALERRKTNLAAAPAATSLSACAAENYVDQSQNWSFSTQSAQSDSAA
jgi:hypothetical protein